MKRSVIAAIAFALAWTPASALAKNITEIVRQRGMAAGASINSPSACGGDFADVNVAEEGYMERGNAQLDQFRRNSVSVYIVHIDCDPEKSYFLIGSNEAGTVKAVGNGRKINIVASASSIDLVGEYGDANHTPITDTATLTAFEAEGALVFFMDNDTSTKLLTNGSYTVRVSTSAENGAVSKLKITLSTARLGSITGQWVGSVNRLEHMTRKLTHH